MKFRKAKTFDGCHVHEYRLLEDIPNEPGIYVYEIDKDTVKCGCSGRLQNRCRALAMFKRVRESKVCGLRFAVLPIRTRSDALRAEKLFFDSLENRVDGTEIFNLTYETALASLFAFSKSDVCQKLMSDPERDSEEKEKLENFRSAIDKFWTPILSSNEASNRFIDYQIKLESKLIIIPSICERASITFSNLGCNSGIPSLNRELHYYGDLIYEEILPLLLVSNEGCFFVSKLPKRYTHNLMLLGQKLDVALHCLFWTYDNKMLAYNVGNLSDVLFRVSALYDYIFKIFNEFETVYDKEKALFLDTCSLANDIGAYLLFAIYAYADWECDPNDDEGLNSISGNIVGLKKKFGASIRNTVSELRKIKATSKGD